MDLWIRSQDKTKLVKVDKILIENSDIGNFEVGMLGTYKTKERALEVLDEIQRLIEDLQYMSYAIVNDKFASYRPNVYQMPKE